MDDIGHVVLCRSSVDGADVALVPRLWAFAQGADVDARHAAGATALHDAAEAGAAEAGCTPAQACIAWAMAKGAAPIPKSLDPERVRATARCLDDVVLTADQVARLDALRDPRRGVEGVERLEGLALERREQAVCGSVVRRRQPVSVGRYGLGLLRRFAGRVLWRGLGRALDPKRDVRMIMDRLAHNRAWAVCYALQERGVGSDRMYVTSKGAEGEMKVDFIPDEAATLKKAKKAHKIRTVGGLEKRKRDGDDPDVLKGLLVTETFEVRVSREADGWDPVRAELVEGEAHRFVVEPTRNDVVLLMQPLAGRVDALALRLEHRVQAVEVLDLSLIHISEPTRLLSIGGAGVWV